ncbi:MAG: RluA family pseudouridine synthase [Victivallaceae bacterium]|nr:RluA family pseudouridine synthase [Victivallaceae bacterium]
MGFESNARIIRSMVLPNDEGVRIDRWLSERFSYLSRHRWQQEIKVGRITVNGNSVRSSRQLHVGECVEFCPEQTEPPVQFDYQIVFEDADLLVVNKGGHLPCHPAGAYFKNTLWYDLSQKYEQVFIVNRLDRETSGLLIVARNSKSAAVLSAGFTENRITKMYFALVYGEFKCPLTADGWLGPDKNSMIRKKRCFSFERPDSSAEKAYTEFEPVWNEGGISLVKVFPHTGRLHQIRATLCSIGFPIVGDKIYGTDEQFFLKFCEDKLTDADWAELKMRRQALHASFLRFLHPSNGKTMEFSAPLPDDFIASH